MSVVDSRNRPRVLELVKAIQEEKAKEAQEIKLPDGIVLKTARGQAAWKSVCELRQQPEWRSIDLEVAAKYAKLEEEIAEIDAEIDSYGRVLFLQSGKAYANPLFSMRQQLMTMQVAYLSKLGMTISLHKRMLERNMQHGDARAILENAECPDGLLAI